MALLSISLLGAFRVYLDEKNVTATFRTRKERALLAYLAVEGGRRLRREAVAELLWPERPEGYARTNLRQALLGVRRAIGGSDTDNLDISDEFIQFKTGNRIWLDLHAFDKRWHLTQTHAHQSIHTCPVCAQNLHEAVDLYRGDFLEDISLADSQTFQEWSVYYREQYFRQLLTTLRLLSDHYQHQGEFEMAYKFAWRYVNLAPLEEDAHRQLMSLLALNGRRSAALEQYQACRQILRDELGVEPSPETETLYEKIKTGLALDLSPRIINLQLSNLPTQLTSFVGRQEEIARLDESLLAPACRLIALTGMAGVGKTRLALQAAGARIAEFADGVWYVPVGSVHDAEGIAVAIVQAVNLPIDTEDDYRSQLFRLLRPLNTLLILDRFDHLVSETPFLVEILQQAPQVKILVTSRERLNYQSACWLDLRGLPYPADGQDPDALQMSGMALFLARARHSRAGFAVNAENLSHLVQILERLEGLPLGIELAAAALRFLSSDQLLDDLERGLETLQSSMHDFEPQHRSIEAALEASWCRLTTEQQQALVHLAELEGEFEFAAITGQAGVRLDTINALADKSMLQLVAPGRYRMPYLVRLFARTRHNILDTELTFIEGSEEDTAAPAVVQLGQADQDGERLFWDRLEHLLARSARRQQVAALLLLHLGVDPEDWGSYLPQTIEEVVARLRTCLRASDTVAFLGDQRFGIILEELTSSEDVHMVAQKVLGYLGDTLDGKGARLVISPKLGGCRYPKDGDEARQLHRHAEEALARARQRERSFVLYGINTGQLPQM